MSLMSCPLVNTHQEEKMTTQTRWACLGEMILICQQYGVAWGITPPCLIRLIKIAYGHIGARRWWNKCSIYGVATIIIELFARGVMRNPEELTSSITDIFTLSNEGFAWVLGDTQPHPATAGHRGTNSHLPKGLLSKLPSHALNSIYTIFKVNISVRGNEYCTILHVPHRCGCRRVRGSPCQ